MLLTFDLELHFEFRAQSFYCPDDRYWDNVPWERDSPCSLIPLDLLEGVCSASFRIFDSRPGVQTAFCWMLHLGIVEGQC